MYDMFGYDIVKKGCILYANDNFSFTFINNGKDRYVLTDDMKALTMYVKTDYNAKVCIVSEVIDYINVSKKMNIKTKGELFEYFRELGIECCVVLDKMSNLVKYHIFSNNKMVKIMGDGVVSVSVKGDYEYKVSDNFEYIKTLPLYM